MWKLYLIIFNIVFEILINLQIYFQTPFMSNTQANRHFEPRQSSSNTLQSNNNTFVDQQSDSDHEPQQQQSTPSPAIQFKDSPIQMKCPFCLQNVRTEVILKPQFISILLGFALFVMFPNVVTLIFTLIILQITSTRKHRCPLCERELGSDGKFLVFFQDQVYSFALGTNGIIVSKKILASIGMGILILVILSVKVNNAYADVNFTDLKWPDYAKQCPYDSKNPKCMYENEGLTVKNWRGFIMRVQDNRNTVKRHFMYAVSLYIKMNDPSTINIKKQQPDIFLTVTSYQAHQWQEKLDKLSHGDEIIFNATFQELRNSKNIPIGRHLNIIEFNLTGIHNPETHVFMSQEEDSWFFAKLSGEKLRKHQQTENDKKENGEKQIEKEVQEELNKALQSDISSKQKQVMQEKDAQNPQNS